MNRSTDWSSSAEVVLNGGNVLAEVIRSIPLYADLIDRVRQGEDRLVVAGGVGALPGLLLAGLARDLGRPVAAVVSDEKEAERLRQDLFAGGLTRIFHAPSPALTPYQRIQPSLKARREEFALLAALQEPRPGDRGTQGPPP